MIRNKIKDNDTKDILELIDKDIYEYIEKNNLYR